MNTDQVWRVVERDGTVHRLRVEESQCPIFDARFSHVALSLDCPGFWSGPSPLGAVAAFAVSSQWDVVEILAPGELTRAEALAALQAQHAGEVAAAVRQERETCARLCEDRAAHLDTAQGEEEPDDADDEEMEGYGRFLEALHLAEAIRGRAIAAPALPDGEVSRVG